MRNHPHQLEENVIFLFTLIFHQQIQVFNVELTLIVVRIHGYAYNRQLNYNAKPVVFILDVKFEKRSQSKFCLNCHT